MPLFGTPRDYSRETYGHEVAEVAKRLGKPLMPWQRYAADVALEIDPDTGELWYEEVDITVPRQSGKSTLILALMVWRCVIMARRLGRQTVTYLAQKGNAARRKLEREFIPILNQHHLHHQPHHIHLYHHYHLNQMSLT
jgi:phage terminase large subunit-like protein